MYHLVKVQQGYKLCESFDAPSLEQAKRYALRRDVSEDKYRNAHCAVERAALAKAEGRS